MEQKQKPDFRLAHTCYTLLSLHRKQSFNSLSLITPIYRPLSTAPYVSEIIPDSANGSASISSVIPSPVLGWQRKEYAVSAAKQTMSTTAAIVRIFFGTLENSSSRIGAMIYRIAQPPTPKISSPSAQILP